MGQILADFAIEFEAEDFESLALSLKGFHKHVEDGVGSCCHRDEMDFAGGGGCGCVIHENTIVICYTSFP
jgi:hypothetical protein